MAREYPPQFMKNLYRLVYENSRTLKKAHDNADWPPWEDAIDESRKRTVLLVNAVVDGVVNTPYDMHMKTQEIYVRNGWTYGPEHKPAWKITPLMADFDQVLFQDRAYYYVLLAVIKSYCQAWDTAPKPN